MKCEKCKRKLDVATLEVRKDNTVERAGEIEVEVGLICECGADYAGFVKAPDLCLMN